MIHQFFFFFFFFFFKEETRGSPRREQMKMERLHWASIAQGIHQRERGGGGENGGVAAEPTSVATFGFANHKSPTSVWSILFCFDDPEKERKKLGLFA